MVIGTRRRGEKPGSRIARKLLLIPIKLHTLTRTPLALRAEFQRSPLPTSVFPHPALRRDASPGLPVAARAVLKLRQVGLFAAMIAVVLNRAAEKPVSRSAVYRGLVRPGPPLAWTPFEGVPTPGGLPLDVQYLMTPNTRRSPVYMGTDQTRPSISAEVLFDRNPATAADFLPPPADSLCTAKLRHRDRQRL